MKRKMLRKLIERRIENVIQPNRKSEKGPLGGRRSKGGPDEKSLRIQIFNRTRNSENRSAMQAFSAVAVAVPYFCGVAHRMAEATAVPSKRSKFSVGDTRPFS